MGCGTGALSEIILEEAAPRSVVGIDPSEGYIAYARDHVSDVPTHFHDFDDYWSPFLGGQAPAPGYAMSLPEEQRSELRERIRSTLPIESDGSIRLVARAWAVRGTP